MKHRTKVALAGLLSAAAITGAACGGGESGGGSDAGTGAPAGSGGSIPEELREDGRYSDERFIDEMVPHHQEAVEMARVGLENAEHEEVRRLSREIIASQEAEIEELQSIKREAFGTSRIPMDMGSGQMEGMTDARSLAREEPFDLAFIRAMIPHHRSAIGMAEAARRESDNPRIKDLAAGVVRAQEREISQMRTWREEWYPQR